MNFPLNLVLFYFISLFCQFRKENRYMYVFMMFFIITFIFCQIIENSALNRLLTSKASMNIKSDTSQNVLIYRQKLLYWIASTLDSSAEGNSNCLIFISDSQSDSLAKGKTLISNTCITWSYFLRFSTFFRYKVFDFYL